MNKEKIYEAIQYQVSTCEGVPVMEEISADEHKWFVESGYGSINELIEHNIANYRDWQSEC